MTAVKHVNLARTTVSAGGTGTITLGVAISGFLTFAAAGANSGDYISYAIEDGLNREIGRGLYVVTGGVATLQRTQIINSTNGNAAITVSANAQVFCPCSAQDLMPAFPKNDPHTAWRVSVVSTTDNSNIFDVYNIEFRQAAGVTEVATVAEAGGIVVASSQHNSDVSNAGNAFAGHTTNALQWAPDGSALPQWAGYVYLSGIAPVEVRVNCSTNVKEMTLDYSDDGGWSWTMFCTLTTKGGIDGGDNLYPINRGNTAGELVELITGDAAALAALASALGIGSNGGGTTTLPTSTLALSTGSSTSSAGFGAYGYSTGTAAGTASAMGALTPNTENSQTILGIYSILGNTVAMVVSGVVTTNWFETITIPGVGVLLLSAATIRVSGGNTYYSWVAIGTVGSGNVIFNAATSTTTSSGG